MAEFLTDIREFALSVSRHWRVGVTGGAIAVALVLAGTLEIRLSKAVVLSALAGYVFVAAFFAWRDERTTRLENPIEQREILEALQSRGIHLCVLWNRCADLSKWRTLILKLRTKWWRKSTLRFVKANCDMQHYDAFIKAQPSPGDIFETEMRRLNKECSDLGAQMSTDIGTIVGSLDLLITELTKAGKFS